MQIDIQNDFVLPSGALSVPNTKDVLPAIFELDRKAKLVIATGDQHELDDVEFETYPVHCLKYSDGANRIDGLRIPTLFMPKVTTKIGNEDYFEKVFLFFIKQHDIGYIDMSGVVSHICVDGAIDSILEVNEKHNLGLKIFVYEDAIKGLDDKAHEEFLEKCRNNPSIVVASVFKWTETTEEGKDIEEIVKELQNGLNLNMRAYYGTEGRVTDKEVDTRELVEGIYNPYLDKVYVR